MAQSVQELKQRVETVELWPESTNDDRCDNCQFYRVLREGIGYCAHRDVDMVRWWPMVVQALGARPGHGASTTGAVSLSCSGRCRCSWCLHRRAIPRR